MDSKVIQDARKWARLIENTPGVTSQCANAARVLLELLPRETLAETGWDASACPMQGADAPLGRVVMIGWDDTAEYPVMVLDEDGMLDYMAADEVTPTGVWYELKEVRA